MQVPKISTFQSLFCSGILCCTIAGVANATPAASTRTAQLSASGQNSSSALKTYESQLGFRFDFKDPYVVDATQAGKGTIVFRNPALEPQAIGSDEPAPVNSDIQTQSSPGDKIIISRFDNPQGLPAQQWAERNQSLSFFDQRQGAYRSYNFAGERAVSYSWCATNTCGDSIVVPSRDGRNIFVLSAMYAYPGNAVRWDFERLAGRFQLTQ